MLGGVGGAAWLAYLIENGGSGPVVCLFRRATGLPCPSCGTSRAILALLAGDWGAAWAHNPIGILVGVALFVLPVWAGYELLFGGDRLFRTYRASEALLRRPLVASLAVGFVLLNWVTRW